MGFLLSFTGKIKTYLALGGAVIGALFWAWFKGRSSGVDATNAKTATKQRKDAHTVQKERTEAQRLDDDELDKEFDRWGS